MSRQRRGIYLLPNLLTTAALFSSFYAIIAAFNGSYVHAAVAVFIAMLLDALDGRIARMTHTQSAFGLQYDSLADMVGFGLAPALLIYLWELTDLGKLGFGVCFVYTAAVALRLARYNAQAGSVDRRFFQGLPSPAAAGVLAGYTWAHQSLGLTGGGYAEALAIGLLLVLAALMVSNIRYHSLKEIDLHGHVRFYAVLVVALIYGLVALRPALILFLGFLGYAASGLVYTLLEVRRRRRRRTAAAAS